MKRIDIDKAKLQAAALFQSALDGNEVIITQNEQPVLKLVRVTQPGKRRQSGSARGLISMSEDFAQPLEDFREYLQ